MSKKTELINTRKQLPALPDDVLKELQPVNYEDVFNSDTAALSVIRKEEGDSVAAKYIIAMLASLEMFYNVKQTLSTPQLQDIARIVLKQYYYLKVADLKLFSDKFKMGEFGKIYDRIDGGVIMEALAKYTNQRLNESEEMSSKKASEFKNSGDFAARNLLEAIAGKWKDVQPGKKAEPVFRSVQQYCTHYGLDAKELGGKLATQVSNDYDKSGIEIDYNDYVRYWMNQWLYDKTIQARK